LAEHGLKQKRRAQRPDAGGGLHGSPPRTCPRLPVPGVRP